MKPVVIVSVAAINYELFEGYTSHADLMKTIDMLSDVVITNNNCSFYLRSRYNDIDNCQAKKERKQITTLSFRLQQSKKRSVAKCV